MSLAPHWHVPANAAPMAHDLSGTKKKRANRTARKEMDLREKKMPLTDTKKKEIRESPRPFSFLFCLFVLLCRRCDFFAPVGPNDAVVPISLFWASLSFACRCGRLRWHLEKNGQSGRPIDRQRCCCRNQSVTTDLCSCSFLFFPFFLLTPLLRHSAGDHDHHDDVNNNHSTTSSTTTTRYAGVGSN